MSGVRSQFPAAKWGGLLLIASLIAIGVSGYLAYVGLTGSKIAGCGGGQVFDCGHVTSSRWSLWMGIPVSLLAISLYVGLIGSLFVGMSKRFSNSVRHLGWALTSTFAIAAGLSAIWFVSLQIFVLNHLCTYCLVAHACGLVVASVVVWQRPIGFVGMKAIASLSVAGVAVLIGGQLVGEAPKPYEFEQFEAPAASEAEMFEFEAPSTPQSGACVEPEVPVRLPSAEQVKQTMIAMLSPATALSLQVTQPASQTHTNQQSASPTTAKQKQDEPAERRLVPVNGGGSSVTLDVSQWPVAGSKSAKYIFVEMFDYSCPHCRKTHAAIKSAKQKLGGDLAVVVLPVPMSAACNSSIQTTNPNFTESCQLSKLTVSVWRVNPAKFDEFHNWMFAAEQAPNYEMAKAEAEKLVGVEKLRKEIESGVSDQYIAKTVELYKRIGKGKIPKLMFPTTSIVGEFTSSDLLVETIKEQSNQ